MVVTENYKRIYFFDSENDACVGFIDDNGELKAVFPIYDGKWLISAIQDVLDYNDSGKVKIPASVYELEKVMREAYTIMVKAFRIKNSVDFYAKNSKVSKETMEKLQEMSNFCTQKSDFFIEFWADKHDYWMCCQGSPYHGGNPENMYPSVRYSLGDMDDQVWPERNAIKSLAYGRKEFDVVTLSEGYVGKKKIKTENEFLHRKTKEQDSEK